jgi:hypothetical protein
VGLRTRGIVARDLLVWEPRSVVAHGGEVGSRRNPGGVEGLPWASVWSCVQGKVVVARLIVTITINFFYLISPW